MNRIQLGTQLAPSSTAPNCSFGKRSSTPSKISVAMVCITEFGMLRKLTDVKFSAPPSQSSCAGRPFLA